MFNIWQISFFASVNVRICMFLLSSSVVPVWKNCVVCVLIASVCVASARKFVKRISCSCCFCFINFPIVSDAFGTCALAGLVSLIFIKSFASREWSMEYALPWGIFAFLHSCFIVSSSFSTASSALLS